MTTTVLVLGGAGYIGSHMVKTLLEAGHHVVTFDDLSTGYRDAIVGGTFEQGNLSDPARLDEVFRRHRIDVAMHFASFIQVGESVGKPAKYYRNNFVNTLNLLDCMIEHGVRRFVFSSTAAIFGDPLRTPMDEAHPRNPVNPYGKTKWMVEQVLADYDRAYGLRSICLRYFNAAGADPDGELGERHDPETHLIPLLLQAASGRRPGIAIYGSDYDTPDGTCIRDYVHVTDLCQAHLLALARLDGYETSAAYNLGNGNGFSIREVIGIAEKVTGRKIAVTHGERRAGDAARLVADSRLAIAELGWTPRYADLAAIIEHAWKWERRHSWPSTGKP